MTSDTTVVQIPLDPRLMDDRASNKRILKATVRTHTCIERNTPLILQWPAINCVVPDVLNCSASETKTQNLKYQGANPASPITQPIIGKSIKVKPSSPSLLIQCSSFCLLPRKHKASMGFMTSTSKMNWFSS